MPRSRSRSRSRSRGRRSPARPSERDRRGRSRSNDRRRNRRRSPSSSSNSSSSGSDTGSSRSRSRSSSRSRTPPRRGRRAGRGRRRSVSSSSGSSRSPSPKRQEKKVVATNKRDRSESDHTEQQHSDKRRHVEDATNERKSDSARKSPERTSSRQLEATPPRQVKQEREEEAPVREIDHKSSTEATTEPRQSMRESQVKQETTPERTPPRRSKRETTPERTPPRRSKTSSTPERKSSRRSKRSTTPDRTPPRRSSKRDAKRSNTPEKRHKKDRRKTSSSPSPPSPSKTTARPPADDKKPNILLDNMVRGRTGGVYIPPFKLAQMRRGEQAQSCSETFQRQSWEALRKSINGLINKVNVSNISNLIPELFQENLVRGRGLLTRSIMKAQLASPGFTHIYAALLAVLNTKLPECGELVVKRVVFRFRSAFKRGDKVVAIALVRFIAHLVNHQIVHELLALEVLTLLLANPTDDSVEVAVNFTKECGQILAELCPEGLRAIFERFRGILHEGEIDKRVQYTIEGLFAIRKGGFADYPAVHEQLDLVESGDQITHEITLEEEINREDQLDVFRMDPEFDKNESMWTAIKKEILGDDSDSDSSGSGSESDDEQEDEEQAAGGAQGQGGQGTTQIQDMTEQDLVNLRRTIYLTIMSSISHEECAHKLLKLNIRPGQEKEICNMLIECCSQERTYLRYFGLLGQRFCMIKREYQDAFDETFAEQYSLIHRLETNKLRNVAKFFAHLLFTDALPWTVFEFIRLNEEDTTSSSRIFIKILCQELSEHMGMKKLKERFLDPIMEQTFAGLFPKDNPRNTRFAINFFTSIGLGGLTTELREYFKNAPAMIMAQSKPESSSSSSSSSDSDSDSDSSSGSSSSSSSGSSSDSSSSDSD